MKEIILECEWAWDIYGIIFIQVCSKASASIQTLVLSAIIGNQLFPIQFTMLMQPKLRTSVWNIWNYFVSYSDISLYFF